jgi:trk system potassium uptake protein TrkA
MCIRGDGCEVPILTEAGTARADVFVAVTGEDEDNLISCQVAKHRFHVPRTIARVRNPQNEPVFKKLGIDFTINATQIILDRITEGVHPDPSLK